MKIFLMLPILLLFLFQSSSCQQPDNNPMVKWKGNDDVNDLVFVFKKDATYEQREKFSNEVLYKPSPDEQGYSHQDGVLETSVGGIKEGYGGGTINFRDTATAEQKERLRKAIEASPIVEKVFVSAVPNKIELPNRKKTETNLTPNTGFKNKFVRLRGFDDVNDLVFVFKKETSFEQQRNFQIEVLDKESSERIILQRDVGRIKKYYEGGFINFTEDSTPEQREKLKKIIEASPIVYKVYENTVPNKIKDL